MKAQPMENVVLARKGEIKEKLEALLAQLDHEPLKHIEQRLREAKAMARILPSRPEESSGDMFPPPDSCQCDLCGSTFKIKGWQEYSHYCPDHKFEVGKMMLQAEVDAHHQFRESGCDMYGSQADPNLDRGWIDGYKAGRFDSMVEKWQKEHPSTDTKCHECGSTGAFCSFASCPMTRPAPPNQ